jgi:hypothetical protein
MTWRLWGLAGRMCFELGMHQYSASGDHLGKTIMEKYRASCLFWSIYVLDRRYSFGTGLPFAIPEDEIDPLMMKPVSLLLLPLSR